MISIDEAALTLAISTALPLTKMLNLPWWMPQHSAQSLDDTITILLPKEPRQVYWQDGLVQG